jgi:nucleotide-binding universal stress UspA family protein
MATSALVGRTLAELHPRRWLVGAVYRNKQLVVPHGDTRLNAGDRVLLVGEPDILPAVVELFRSSESEFPLQYGTHVVALCGKDLPVVLEEAAWLVKHTKADKLEAIACDVSPEHITALAERCHELDIPYEFSCEAETTHESLVQEAQRRDVGVLILAPEPLPFLARVGLGRTRTASVVDMVLSPVLVARSRHPYRKVLLVLAELPFHLGAAQLAIDLVRMVGAELTLALVHQPELVVGAELRAEMEERRREILSLASLYHVPVTVRELEGNPVTEVLAIGGDYDLAVLSQPRRRRAFLTRPDVSLNLIHRLPCSVMTMPFDPER